jgi:predicted metal-dependent phosphoesterase TrpH
LLSPKELIALARRERIDVLAITDHDTTAGLHEAALAASGSPVLIPGVEIGAEDDDQAVDMLGYCLDPDHAHLQHQLQRFREGRQDRGRRILDRLQGLGLPLDWDRVLEIAEGGSLGRPHIAQAMVEAGYAEDINDAFDRYLRTGGPAFVGRPKLTPEDAIDLIHEAGGVAVLAHPGLIPYHLALIPRLIRAGLDGLEVQHGGNNYTVRENLRGLARQHKLLMTGGSDFHRPRYDQLGTAHLSPETLPLLRTRARRYRKDSRD